MVKRAFELLTNNEIPTKLIAFSDDMDGFRKVPSNLPNQEMLAEHLHLPLTKVPDRFGIDESSPTTTSPPVRVPRQLRFRIRVYVLDNAISVPARLTRRC